MQPGRAAAAPKIVRRALLALLLVGCPSAPGEEPAPNLPPEPDDTPAYQSPYGDPIEVLDTYGGPSFSELNEVQAQDGLVYFCSGVLGMNVYDATNPEDLVFVARSDFSLASSAYPRCQHVVPDGAGRVYVSNRSNSIQPQSWIGVATLDDRGLTEVGMHVLPFDPEGMYVHDDLLLVAAHDVGLVVYRRGDGGDLTELARVPTDNAWGVTARDGLAWVADGAGGLVTVDLTDPAAPEIVHTLPLEGAAKHLRRPPDDVAASLGGDLLAVAAGTAGVVLVDLADPRAPTLRDAVDTPGTGTAVAWMLAEVDGTERPAVVLADWADVRVFEVVDGALGGVAREPLPLGPSNRRESRTMGIAAAGDVFFSGNWSELVSYRWFPDRSAPDLEVSHNPIVLPDAERGDTARFPLRVTNSGTEDLTFRGLDSPLADVLSVDLPETLAPGQTAVAMLSIDVFTEASIAGRLLLLSDDPDQPSYELHASVNRPGRGVGADAPPAVFDDIDGDAIELEGLEGSVVLLAYFATF